MIAATIAAYVNLSNGSTNIAKTLTLTAFVFDSQYQNPILKLSNRSISDIIGFRYIIINDDSSCKTVIETWSYKVISASVINPPNVAVIFSLSARIFKTRTMGSVKSFGFEYLAWALRALVSQTYHLFIQILKSRLAIAAFSIGLCKISG